MTNSESYMGFPLTPRWMTLNCCKVKFEAITAKRMKRDPYGRIVSFVLLCFALFAFSGWFLVLVMSVFLICLLSVFSSVYRRE